MLGHLAYATTQDDYTRLWAAYGAGHGMYWDPSYTAPPDIDLERYFVLFYNRAEDGCPDTLESLEVVGDRLMATFTPPPGPCNLPLVAATYAVAVDRETVPAHFTAYLEGYPSKPRAPHPDTLLEIDLTRLPGPLGDALLMRCGEAVAGYRTTPPTSEPLDSLSVEAMGTLGDQSEGVWFADHFTWGVWDRTDATLTLLGIGEGPADLASATFEWRDESWRPTGWGTCGWTAFTPTQGAAPWDVDMSSPPGPESTEIHIVATELACAGGQAPDGRAIDHVLIETDTTVTILVLVDMLQSGVVVTCPTNPSFPHTVQLSSPLGARTIVDGAFVPGIPR